MRNTPTSVRWATAVAATSLAALVSLAGAPASALPMYAMRSARTCANCHISPTLQDAKGWDNPKLSKRKCNMSCMSCHVNPTGGGLRNTSGRYYGKSTVAMVPTVQRSYSDHGRELLPASWIRWLRRAFGNYASPSPPKRAVPQSGDGPTSKTTDAAKTIPSSYADVQAGIGVEQRGGFTQFLKPWLGPSEYAYWDGRYGGLNADPAVSFGGDFRFSYFSGSSTFFPMQADLNLAVHPVEHLTLMATGALRGQTGGFGPTFDQDRSPVFARNAFAMVHELPFMAYVKGGIFLPSFGTHTDDHTSFVREFLEMDVSQSEDTVVGAEIGAAPNYPFISASFFRNLETPDAAQDADPGFGAAANLGWRDLAWSLSAHWMLKRRDLSERGDLDAVGIAWGFNPFFLSNSIPLTYMGEFDFGWWQRPVTGSRARFIAMYHELWATLLNGVILRLKYDLGDRDLELADSLEQRMSFGVDLGLIPGLTLNTTTRVHFAQARDARADVMFQTHLWF